MLPADPDPRVRAAAARGLFWRAAWHKRVLEDVAQGMDVADAIEPGDRIVRARIERR